MTKKKFFAVGLCVVMVGAMLGGCSTLEPEESSLSEAAGSARDSSGNSGDMREITVVYPWLSSLPGGAEAVEAEINKITEKEINTHVHLELIETGSYAQQVSLMVTSNETIDLMVNFIGGSTAFSTMSAQNQLMDITQLLLDYAPKAMEAVGDLIGATTVEGKVYGFPAYKNFASGQYIEMRTDVLADLGLLEKAKNMKSFTEYEEILEAVKNSEKWGNLAGIVGVSKGELLLGSTTYVYADKFEDTTFIDNLGDTLQCVGIDYGGNTVYNAYASEAFKSNYEMVKRWYDKGYVYKDAATTPELGNDLIKSGAAFSMINTMGVGAEAAADSATGRDMTCVLIASAPVSAGSCTQFTWSVPMTAAEPEAAVSFLELMFNDERIANLMAWGIEGVDYEVDSEGVAHYIKGNETPDWHGVSFLVPNEFTVTPWEGETLENWKAQEEYMKSAPVSEYVSFAVDTSTLTNEISAVNTVITEFKPQICSGMADETTFDAFLKKLEASGIDKIVNYYQEQINLWRNK